MTRPTEQQKININKKGSLDFRLKKVATILLGVEFTGEMSVKVEGGIVKVEVLSDAGEDRKKISSFAKEVKAGIKKSEKERYVIVEGSI